MQYNTKKNNKKENHTHCNYEHKQKYIESNILLSVGREKKLKQLNRSSNKSQIHSN